MIRLIIILLIALVSSGSLCSQSNDTTVFFRCAATFDQLMPSPYYPLSAYIPDSATLEIFNGNPKNVTMMKAVSISQINDGKAEVFAKTKYQFKWDAEGRLTNYASFSPADTIPYEQVRVQYLIREKASNVYLTTPAVSNRNDTVSFQYNRMGLVSTWNYRMHSADSNSIRTGTYLYDSRGRVIVATNMNYGPLKGSYTYEYNANGQLIRRTFNAGGSGIILCTDTLEYAPLTASSSIIMVTHKLKVAGMEKWALLETKTIYPYSGVVMSYSDYNDADSNYLYQNYPESTVRYEYDDKGRMTGEFFGTTANPDLFSAKYYYSDFNQPDSIVYSERIIDKKVTFTRVYSRDVRTYNSQTGLIQSREVTTILYEEMKKKDNVPPTERVEINYQWR